MNIDYFALNEAFMNKVSCPIGHYLLQTDAESSEERHGNLSGEDEVG